MGNFFVYPIPKPSYEANQEDPTLLMVPNRIESPSSFAFCSENRVSKSHIPCRYIPCQTRKSPYLILFFHGNSEDIGLHLSRFLCSLSDRFEMNVLCPEYPGYGIYKDRDTTLTMEEAILQDSKRVITYCHTHLKFPYENIIVVGRSLGSAVAVRLASKFAVRGTVLISPFTSIRETAKHLVGGAISRLVSDIFKSIDHIDKVKKPIMIIHGQNDELVPHHMARQLYDKAVAPKQLKINKTMTHNFFRMEDDICLPIETFMRQELELNEHILTFEYYQNSSSFELSPQNLSKAEEQIFG